MFHPRRRNRDACVDIGHDYQPLAETCQVWLLRLRARVHAGILAILEQMHTH